MIRRLLVSIAICLVLSDAAWAQSGGNPGGSGGSTIACTGDCQVGIGGTALPTTTTGSETIIDSTDQFILGDNVTGLKLQLPCEQWTASGPVTPGADCVWEASISGPGVAGSNCTRFTLSASTSMTVTKGTIGKTDLLAFAGVKGQLYKLTLHLTSASALPYYTHQVGDTVNPTNYGTSGITDNTATCGTSGQTTNNFVYAWPVAILATNPAVESFTINGDSREACYADSPNELGAPCGYGRILARLKIPYIAMGIPSRTAAAEGTIDALRLGLMAETTKFIGAYGINDIIGAATKATTETNINAVNAILKANVQSGVGYQVTLEPYTTTSDSCATVANQTVGTPGTNVLSLNADLRAGLNFTSIAGYIDVARMVDPQLSGKWQLGAAPFAPSAMTAYTDCIHPSQTEGEMLNWLPWQPPK